MPEGGGHPERTTRRRRCRRLMEQAEWKLLPGPRVVPERSSNHVTRGDNNEGTWWAAADASTHYQEASPGEPEITEL
jgi:hypothetical protein